MSSFKPNYFQRRSKPQGPKANERIRALDVQVISSEGNNLGPMQLNKAIELGYKVITDYSTSTGVVFSVGLYDTQEEKI